MAKDKIVEVSTGYVPRKHQIIFHRLMYMFRFVVMVCHRRWGKTIGSLNEMVDRGLKNPLRNPQYAYIAPTYKQAKRVAWKPLQEYTRNIPGYTRNKTDLIISIERPERRCPVTGKHDPDEISYMIIGSDDPDALRGIYLDGAIIDEFAQCDPIVWGEIIRPALADRRKTAEAMLKEKISDGIRKLLRRCIPWAVFIGTPKGQNHFYRRYMKAKSYMQYASEYEAEHDMKATHKYYVTFDEQLGITDDTPEAEVGEKLARLPKEEVELYRAYRKYIVSLNWSAAMYKASETGILGREETEEMVEDLTEDQVAQELECDFTAAILGSYFGHKLNEIRKKGHIGNFPYCSAYPVDTFWDIGVHDKCTIWFRQKVGMTYVYIDYFEYNGEGLDFYIKMLQAKAGGIGTRVEIKPKVVVQGEGYVYGRHVWPHDGNVREFTSGDPRWKTAKEKGLNVKLHQRTKKQAQIEAGRTHMSVAYFDVDKCARGLECLYNYEKVWDDKLSVFKEKPLKNWAGHGADGFMVSAQDLGPSEFPNENRNLPRTVRMDYDVHGR